MYRLLRAGLLGIAALLAAVGAVWLALPEYDRPDLAEIWRYASDPRYVVNVPIAYQILRIGMGAEDRVLAERIDLPPGHRIRVYADDLPHARVLCFTAGGHLLVSQGLEGRVTLLEPDRDGDGRADGARVLLEGLRFPNGLAVRAGWLYVAQPGGVARVRFDESAGGISGELETILELPDTHGHNTRPLRFGPDGWLYTAVGTACNACVIGDPRQGVVLRVRPDGGPPEVVASGFRNPADLGWHPVTGALYALDVGRDFAGDDFPPEELDRIEPGGFYGFPFFHGDGLPDPDLPPPDEQLARSARGPAHEFPAHSTPLGLAFLPGVAGGDTPEALVALHGSWNRTTRVGYSLVGLAWDAEGRIRERPFATGFGSDDDVIGRPVHVAPGPDAAIYVSDDFAGVVYRIERPSRRRSARP